jgi:flagellar hook-length control protein FliK
MDVVKPVDSPEPLFPARPSSSSKPAAGPRQSEPSAFTRMLKKKSQAKDRAPDSSPLVSPERRSVAKRDAVSSGQGSGSKAIEPLLEVAAATDDVTADQMPEQAFDPTFQPIPEPAAVTIQPLEPAKGGWEVAPVDAAQGEQINDTEPAFSEADLEAFPVAQLSIPPLLNADAGITELNPTDEVSTNMETEVALAVDAREFSLTPDILPDPESGQNPLLATGKANAASIVETSANAGNELHIDAVSQLARINPLAEGQNPPGMEGSFEILLSPGENRALQSEGGDPAALAKVQTAEVPQVESSADGAKPDAAQSAQVPPMRSTTEPSEPDLKITSPHLSDEAKADRAEGLANRIGTSIIQAASGGKVLRMRLHPPELGILQIEVASVQGTVTARLDVESAHAHRAILENLPQLHEMLSRTQTQIDRIELNMLDSREGLDGHSRQFGQSASDRNSSGERPSPEVRMLHEDNHSRAKPDSFAKTRQPDDWRSRSLPLSGIDIQV